jgi:hypothetical protein
MDNVQPRGYDPHRITEPPAHPIESTPAEDMADRILMGLRIRAVARRALKMGTLALVATAVLTGVTVGNGGTAQAATAIEAPQPDPAPAPVSARFGLGTWLDIENGVVWVSAPVRTTAPASALPRVQVQELTPHGVVSRGRLRVRANHVARGLVYLGVGTHRVRVVLPGLATGRWRTVISRATEEAPGII